MEIDFACVKSLLDFKLELFQQFYSLLVEQFKEIDSFIVQLIIQSINTLHIWPSADKFATGLLKDIKITGAFEKRAEVWAGYLEHCITGPKLQSAECGDKRLAGLEWNYQDVRD